MPVRRRHVAVRRLAVFGPAAIVLIVGALAYATLQRSLSIRGWVIHSHSVLDASSDLLTTLLEAESAQRGFILTSDSTTLDPYRVAPTRVDTLLGRLRGLTQDNPTQQLRLDTLTSRVHERLAWIDSSVSIPSVRQEIIQRQNGPVLTPDGRAVRRRKTLDVRRIIASIDSVEDALLKNREKSEQASLTLTSVVLALGTIAAAILALLVNRSLDAALRDRRLALNDANAANEQLQEQAIELETQADAAQTAALEAEQANEEAQVARRAAQESEERAERLQVATEAFSGALALAEVAQLIVDQAMAALGAESGALGAYNKTTEGIEFIALRNMSTASVGFTIGINDDGPMTSSVRNKQPVLLPSEEAILTAFPKLARAHRLEEVQSVAAFPLAYGGQVLGSLLVRWKTPRALSAVDVSFMTALSRIAAESFDRARLFDGEREARTAAEGANRAKAAFLASMSHELRTPLQAALGFAQLVRSEVYGPINDAQAEALNRVERSQTHLAHLIDDILDFARLEAGRIRVNAEPIAAADMFSDLAPLVESQATTKTVDLVFVPPAGTFKILGDRQRLQQVLVNLVGNAIKFTPTGGSIRVIARRAGERVIVQVCDTGVGIPDDRLSLIFEPFVQVDDKLTRTQPGTGLGLAISRDLARAMGGDITVESEVGKGSTFSVILPVAAERPALEAAS